MSEIEVARDGVEMVPDRWAKTGWKWQQKGMPKTYFQHRLIETFKEPGVPTTVDSEHMGLVPSPWKPSGWRYVTADFQHKQHPNIRNFDRRSRRARDAFHSSFTTTTMANFGEPSPKPELEQHQRHQRKKQNPFPPVPMNIRTSLPATSRHRKYLSTEYYSPPKSRTLTLGGLLSGNEPRELPLGWAGETIDPKPGSFNKRKQVCSEWQELLLSGGVIH